MNLVAAAFGLGCAALLAREATAADLETVVVTATALPGTTLDLNQIATNVQSFSAADLMRAGPANALQTLSTEAVGVSLADAQDNPLQPNLFYRGFEASPLAGDAQGLAVYVDGVRFNQPFGDVVNWDLIPDVAIGHLTVEGSNPVFGLNALGGSVSVQLKNGFDWQGAEAEAFAGSFGRAQTSLQYGESDGDMSVYAAATGLNDNGWRDHSPTHAAQDFADFGWRKSGTELHLSVIGASTALTGNGPAPVELLAVDRSAIFTFPDKTDNGYALANLSGSSQIGAALSVRGNVYLSRFRQRTRNGDASDAAPCDSGELCLDDRTILTDASGNPIPDFLSGGVYAQLNLTSTDTRGFGGSLQSSYRQPVLRFDNQFLAGVAYDGGRTDFAAQSDLGALTPARGFRGPGIVIDTVNGEISPVKILGENDYYGIYAADVLNLSRAFSLNISARFNTANIALHDGLGDALNGSHSFGRLNPAFGMTYRLSPGITFYAGYAEANRTPTPAEFSCANASAPCSLTNFFVADPSLKQVVAHSLEAGAHGVLHPGKATIHWHTGLYRVDADDDIMFVASPLVGRGFFRNIGATRRQGAELSADVTDGPWSISLSYAYTDATFRSALSLNSPDNPKANANGEIQVMPGDSLPTIPKSTLKLVTAYQPSDIWNIGFAGRYAAGQYLRGDESNLNPKTGPYFVLDLSAAYRLDTGFEILGEIENLLDTRYETFGTFSPTSEVPIGEVPAASNPRSLSPAAPIAAYAGIRVWL